MRIGGVFEWKYNAFYRSVGPLQAMARRGHDVRIARSDDGPDRGAFHSQLLLGSDVIHGYRMLPPEELKVVAELQRRGAAFVWDTDDDLEAVPVESPAYRTDGGRHGRVVFRRTVEIAKTADLVTTTSEALAQKYRDAGVERVERFDNYLLPSAFGVARPAHDGIVVGWVAGLEHGTELTRIPLEPALRRLAKTHPDVRIVSIGLALDLSESYENVWRCDWQELQAHIARWDIAIAPLADIGFNRSRSDVKLKEYASAGTPWLASPAGPYLGYGEREGGRLVADDGWFEALDQLVRDGRRRKKLGKQAVKWAKSQQIDHHVERWEALLQEAVERRARRGALV